MKRTEFMTLIAILMVMISQITSLQAQTITTFSHQGFLRRNGEPANGTFDFRFRVVRQDGTQVGNTLTRANVAVSKGMFYIELDFGNIFDGSILFLDVSVRPANQGNYTPLSPRVPFLRVPYAIYANRTPWSGLIGIPAGFADGIDNDTQYSAGAGLSLTGTVFSILDGGVVNSMLASNAVSTAKIQNNAISSAKIADGAVTDPKIHSVSWSKITGAPAGAEAWALSGNNIHNTNPGHVGIRTTNPQGKLHVVGQHGTAPTLLLSESDRDIAWTAGEWLQFGEWDGSTFTEHFILRSGGDIGIGIQAPQAKLHVNGSGLFNGNVGIGTTTPTERLHVAGNVFATGIFSGNGSGLTNVNASSLQGRSVASTTPANGQALKWNGAAWSPANDQDTTYSAGAGLSLTGTTFSIANGGVQQSMIGTTNAPSAGQVLVSTGSNLQWQNQGLSLPFSATTSTAANTPAFKITNTGEAGTMELILNNATGNSPTLQVRTTGLGHAGRFVVDNPNSTVSALRGNSNGGGPGVFGYNTGTGLAGRFEISNTANSSPALSVLTDGSGPALHAQAGTGLAGRFSGNVWIEGALRLGASASPGFVLTASADGTGSWQVLPPSTPTGPAGGDLTGTYPNPTVARFQGRSVANTAPANGQVLKWNGTSWSPSNDLEGSSPWLMSGSSVYYNGGNVGIGTSNPAAKLQVMGGDIIFPGASQGNPNSWSTHFAFPDGKNYLRGTTVIADTGGNVGIGTNNPVDRLTVAGPNAIISVFDGPVHTRLFSAAHTGFGYIGTATGHGFVIRTSDQERIVILPDGRVGIGLTSPSHKLTIESGDENTLSLIGPGGIGERARINFGDENYVRIIEDSDDNLRITADPSGGVGGGRIWLGDRVGIGTGSPTRRLTVNGDFNATGNKQFQIDHPLDPANYFLNHFCTEGPEPYNLYRGNVVTDQKGFAVVELPAYFDRINRDFHYQLTVIDEGDDFVFAKVAHEIHNNQFTIRTSKPNVKVSWTVTAVRNDAWVQMNGFSDEEPKPADLKGKFYVPEFYGQPRELGIGYDPEDEERSKLPKQKQSRKK